MFGAVLSLMDGPTWCDLALVWFRFRLLRRYLALWPSQVGRAGFRWDPVRMGWYRPGLPLLSTLAGPVQHFKVAILDAWRNMVSADLYSREGFRSGPLLDFHGSLQLLNSGHVERHTALLRSVMVRGVWNGFLLGGVRSQPVPCRFCGTPDSDGHLFGEMYLSSPC